MNFVEIAFLLLMTLVLSFITGCTSTYSEKLPGKLLNSPDAAAALKEANATFTYKGKPIHPKLVEKFEGWISDGGGPNITEVNVSNSFGSNEYFETPEVHDSWVSYQRGEGAGGYGDYYEYQHLGKFADGTHIIKGSQRSGGSLTYESLIFIRFLIGPNVDLGMPQGHHLMMRVCGSYYLRKGADVKVRENDVVVNYPDDMSHSVILNPHDNDD